MTGCRPPSRRPAPPAFRTHARLPHREHGAGRLAHHLLGHAAEQQVPDRAAPVGAHHEHGRWRRPWRSGRSRRTRGRCGRPAAGSTVFVRDLLQMPFGVGLPLVEQIRHDGRRRADRPVPAASGPGRRTARAPRPRTVPPSRGRSPRACAAVSLKSVGSRMRFKVMWELSAWELPPLPSREGFPVSAFGEPSTSGSGRPGRRRMRTAGPGGGPLGEADTRRRSGENGGGGGCPAVTATG